MVGDGLTVNNGSQPTVHAAQIKTRLDIPMQFNPVLILSDSIPLIRTQSICCRNAAHPTGVYICLFSNFLKSHLEKFLNKICILSSVENSQIFHKLLNLELCRVSEGQASVYLQDGRSLQRMWRSSQIFNVFDEMEMRLQSRTPIDKA